MFVRSPLGRQSHSRAEKDADGGHGRRDAGDAPGQFQCVACGLKINGLSQLNATILGSPFKTTATYNAADYFYPGDDEDGRYEDDNNEPF